LLRGLTALYQKDFAAAESILEGVVNESPQNVVATNNLALALIEGERLDRLHRDHQLVGDYAGRRECHIEADWLLIYKLEKNRIVFERMGSHADLFE